MLQHPIDRVSELLSSLENALDDCYADDDGCSASQTRFLEQFTKKVEALSREWSAETGEQEDYDSYVANREAWRDI